MTFKFTQVNRDCSDCLYTRKCYFPNTFGIVIAGETANTYIPQDYYFGLYLQIAVSPKFYFNRRWVCNKNADHHELINDC